jgi:hypothetical protein
VTPESSTTQAQRFPLLLSFRILYTTVSFGPTLGSDVSAEDICVTRKSFMLINYFNFKLRSYTTVRFFLSLLSFPFS